MLTIEFWLLFIGAFGMLGGFIWLAIEAANLTYAIVQYGYNPKAKEVIQKLYKPAMTITLGYILISIGNWVVRMR